MRLSKGACGLAPALFVALFLARVADAASNAVYDSTCALCHQNGGAGLKGQFPRLAGRVDRMAADPQARVYLIDTLLFGISGKIEVDGAPIVGVMPSFAMLSDDDLASVLNYLIRLGGRGGKKVTAFTPAEIRGIRAGPHRSTTQVAANRAALASAGRIP
jgi:mono/diheme cytochrome c family protein